MHVRIADCPAKSRVPGAMSLLRPRPNLQWQVPNIVLGVLVASRQEGSSPTSSCMAWLTAGFLGACSQPCVCVPSSSVTLLLLTVSRQAIASLCCWSTSGVGSNFCRLHEQLQTEPERVLTVTLESIDTGLHGMLRGSSLASESLSLNPLGHPSTQHEDQRSYHDCRAAFSVRVGLQNKASGVPRDDHDSVNSAWDACGQTAFYSGLLGPFRALVQTRGPYRWRSWVAKGHLPDQQPRIKIHALSPLLL